MRANLIWPYLCYFEKWFQVHRGGGPSNIAHNDKCSENFTQSRLFTLPSVIKRVNSWAVSSIYLAGCNRKDKQLLV